MKRNTGRRWGWLGALAAAAVLTGCDGAKAPSGGGGSASGGMQIGMVTDVGGTGDLSFNWGAWNGLEKAKQELGVQTSKVESSQASDYGPNLRRLAERGCKLIFAVGFALKPAIEEVAPKYPDVKFVLIDDVGPSEPNVASLVFREEEGSFLVGALAGGMSKRNSLGFVGGMDIPLIKKFEAGYRAGVMTTNPGATVTAKFTGNWEAVDKGKELALSLFDQGADVVMHAAGKCGVGVIKAAKEKGPGYWAIGVDADQDYLGTETEDAATAQPPSRVLTSMLKRVDNAVFATCKDVASGNWKAGKHEFGVKDDGVGLTELKFTKQEIPPKLLAEVERLEKMIADGTLKPPATMEALRSFKAPAVKLD